MVTTNAPELTEERIREIVRDELFKCQSTINMGTVRVKMDGTEFMDELTKRLKLASGGEA